MTKPKRNDFSSYREYKQSYNSWHRAHNPEYHSDRHKKYNRGIKGLYSRLKRQARSAKVACDISMEDLVELRKIGCVYECGNSLSSASPSLDRINPKAGYTKDNVVPCCIKCNMIKGDWWTFEEMLVANRAVNALRASLDKEKIKSRKGFFDKMIVCKDET